MPDDPETRLKRLRMRSWRGGMKETDLILGPYADAVLAMLPPEALDLYERLLGENDQDILAWVTGADAVPAPFGPAVARIRDRLPV